MTNLTSDTSNNLSYSPLCRLPKYEIEESRNNNRDIVELTGEDLYKAFGAESMAEHQGGDRNGLYIVSDNLGSSARNCNVSYGTTDSGSAYDEQGHRRGHTYRYQDGDLDNPYVVRDNTTTDRRDGNAKNAVLPLHVRTFALQIYRGNKKYILG